MNQSTSSLRNAGDTVGRHIARIHLTSDSEEEHQGIHATIMELHLLTGDTSPLKEGKMERNNMDIELRRRDFVRSAALLGTGIGVSALVSACSDPVGSPPPSAVNGRNWIQANWIDAATGVFTSAACSFDSAELNADAELSGYEIHPSGEITPHSSTLFVDNEQLSLQSLGNGHYQLVADGIPQPPGAPFEIYLIERNISDTTVGILTGYSLDPNTDNRVRFALISNYYGDASAPARSQLAVPRGPVFSDIDWQGIIYLIIQILEILSRRRRRRRRHRQGGGG